MSTVRYVIGVILLVSLPPGILLWFAIHPFIRFWRRLGAVWTYVALSPLVLACMLAAFAVRDAVLGRDLGSHLWLLGPAAVCVASGTVIAVMRRRHLKYGILMGLPELSPDQHSGRLLTDGIYARIRHPRYVEVLLFTAAYAFLANYVGCYVATALTIPALYVTVLLEERELRDRFGTAFEEYARRVPRFLPLRRRD
jgi:protein-S-isoprenylcysteine O-methyltransferase Ste14